MNEDIHEPLEYYQNTLRESHAQHTRELFEELLARAQVDEAANQRVVGAMAVLAAQLAALSKRTRNWRALRVFTILGLVSAVAWVGYVLYTLLGGERGHLGPTLGGLVVALAGGTGGLWLWLSKLNPQVRALVQEGAELATRRAQHEEEAWEQMAPLNRLYEWDMITNLVQKSMPHIVLDPYLHQARLIELRQSFGWSDAFNENKSVLASQSGTIRGNPFILCQLLEHEMGMHTYTGTLNISWRERETDAEGRLVWRTRHQVLVATISRPAPQYSKGYYLIYGNEAAPTLSFSRVANPISRATGTWSGKRQKRRAIKKLEKFSRNLDDESQFTMMANKDFEALFNAPDRDDEVEFRLLFTPLAQQQMVKLLTDRQIGYGDNFAFIKNKLINIIQPAHLNDLDISTDPANFQSYDLQAARLRFNAFSNKFFKDFYFSLAPLLAIPLYQQHRSHADIYREVYYTRASFWEEEAVANDYGEEYFKHEACVTPSLLKTTRLGSATGAQRVRVRAHGYRTIERTEYVSKMGGDGRMHQVPVHWTEYVPVHRDTLLDFQEVAGLSLAAFRARDSGDAAWQRLLSAWQRLPPGARLRRSIVSSLPE